MRGAIIGDIMGSPYEFVGNKEYWFPPFYERRCFTDDTVMTIAVAKALMESKGKSDDEVKLELVKQMKKFGREHINAGFGGMMGFWLESESTEPYQSWGNGSAMRVASVAWLCDSIEEVLHTAKLTAEVTHDSVEGIRGAQAVALAAYLARIGNNKRKIKKILKETFPSYNFERTVDSIRSNYHFDVSCEGSVPEAIICFLESESFDDALRNAISLGGDADTQGAMAGAIAEAYYGEDVWDEYTEYLPDNFLMVVEEFDKVKHDRVQHKRFF